MAVERIYLDNVFTYILSGGTLTIDPSWGVERISIKCTSATAGTVLGSGKLGGNSSAAITLSQGDSMSLTAASGKILTGIVITAPGGCNLEIVSNANA